MQLHNGDVALHLELDGDPSAPPVLFLHEITATARTWEWFVPHLADRFHVLRLDFRGHGQSDRTTGRYDVADYISDAATACEQVAQRPCVLIGHSLGGSVAAGLAQQRPELVRAVVLEDPPVERRRSDAAAEPEDDTALDGFRLLRESVSRLQAESVPVEVVAENLAGAPSPAGPTFGELLHADAVTAMAAGMLELDASVLDPVLDRSMRAVFDPDRPIPVPTMLLTADPVSPDAVAHPLVVEQLIATTPAAEVHVMVGASHHIHDGLAHRAAFAAAVEQFLDRLPG